MDIEALRDFCLSFPEVSEGFPFGEDYLVFKVLGKMFALINLNSIPITLNLKCHPTLALQLREQYPSITAGYHMNKTHWNTISTEGISPMLLRKMITHSYEQVVKRLPKAQRHTLPYTFQEPFPID